MFEKKFIEELFGITKPWRIDDLVMEEELGAPFSEGVLRGIGLGSGRPTLACSALGRAVVAASGTLAAEDRDEGEGCAGQGSGDR